jgi:hypothetical protein
MAVRSAKAARRKPAGRTKAVTLPKSSAEKVRAHRAKLRKMGLRPVQIWIPDVNSPEFIREAHRQSLAVANSPYAAHDQAFVDAITQWPPDGSDE